MTSNPSATGADTHHITAVFDTRDAAETARTDLLRAGFPEADIRFAHGAEAANAATPAADPSVLSSLLDIFVFMPSHDKSSYGEALRRGGTALAVRTTRERYEHAIDILDRDGAVDLDERATAWATEGRTGTEGEGGAGVSPDSRAFGATHAHDPLVNPGANGDMRERIGVGTSDQTAGMDLAPASAAGHESRTAIPGGDERSVTARRDTGMRRRRVRSYVTSVAAVPTGIDPQI